jgi:alanine racemase
MLQGVDMEILHLLYDSRRVQEPSTSLFFALQTKHNNGHRFIAEALEKGVRAFVVSEKTVIENALVIEVDDTLAALHKLGAYHRSQYNIPVIGITGSNGKTVVKEWLNQLLEEDYTIVRSPKSFNSQLGVPLSIWEMSSQHSLGIFEAGISTVGEMKKLEAVIQPTIGVLTNLGEAHNGGFSSKREKLAEKLQLFKHCNVVIGEKGLLKEAIQPVFTWSRNESADVLVQSVQTAGGQATIRVTYREKELSVTIPFTDEASIENGITCLCVLLYLKDADTINPTLFLSCTR